MARQLLKQQAYIDGQWVGADGGGMVAVTDPATGDIIAHVPDMGAAETARAITRKIGPALAAGCAVVLKPALQTPLSALALAALAEEAGLPAGLFNVVTGDAHAIGGELTSNNDVRKISFTGSTAVGRALMQQSANSVKKMSLELGGNAPFIVFDDADLDAAVEGAIQSKFRNSGQTCVCTNRFYAQAGIHDRFVEALARRTGALQLGPGLDDTTDLGPLIDAAAVAKVQAHVDDALAKGGTLMTGGSLGGQGGTYFQPTVVAGVTVDMLLTREETFGPLAGVIRFDTEEEVVASPTTASSGWRPMSTPTICHGPGGWQRRWKPGWSALTLASYPPRSPLLAGSSNQDWAVKVVDMA